MRFISIPFSIVYSLLLLLLVQTAGAQNFMGDKSALNTISLSAYHFPAISSSKITLASRLTTDQPKSTLLTPISYARIMIKRELAIHPQCNLANDKMSRNYIIGGVLLISAGTVALLWNNSMQKQNNRAKTLEQAVSESVIGPLAITTISCGVISLAGGYFLRSLDAKISKKEAARVPTETF